MQKRCPGDLTLTAFTSFDFVVLAAFDRSSLKIGDICRILPAVFTLPSQTEHGHGFSFILVALHDRVHILA